MTSYDELLMYFVQKVDKFVTSQLTARPVHWEEVFFAAQRAVKINPAYALDKGVLVEIWTDSANVAAVTQAGYQAVAAPSNYWYTDNLTNTWDVMYNYDPATGLTTSQKSYLIGGEVVMFVSTLTYCVCRVSFLSTDTISSLKCRLI